MLKVYYFVCLFALFLPDSMVRKLGVCNDPLLMIICFLCSYKIKLFNPQLFGFTLCFYVDDHI